MNKQYKDQIAPVPYDPTWLVELAKKQIPDKLKIIESLKLCTTIIGFCNCGCGDPYFIDPKSKEWEFDTDETLEREDGVDIILNVMRDKRVGAIETGEWDKKQ